MQGLSLAFLIGAIAIGFFRKINVGVVSIVLGFVLTLITHGKMNVLFAGFPTKLFLTLLGTMFFFCLLQENKTFGIIIQKNSKLISNQTISHAHCNLRGFLFYVGSRSGRYFSSVCNGYFCG
jgi:hypothetical protein